MFTARSPFVLVPSFVVALAACSGDAGRAPPVAPSALTASSSAFITGSVLGPAGSVCGSLPDGSLLRVRAINLATQSFAASQALSCPTNTYSLFVPDGTYLVRVDLPAIQEVLGDLPWRTITTPPVEVAGSDVVRDIIVPVGTPLGGGATIDGQPIEGMTLNLTYEQAPGFAATATTSGPDGAWMEFFGRSPARLQAGIRLRSSAVCETLGGILQQAPLEAFLFPDEASGLTCALATAPAVQFSHDRTRVVVTPMPGDIGGTSPALFDQFGMGWGVQFPVNAGERPMHGPIARSELFLGGLLVGIRPDRLLSGVDLGGYVQCAPVCRDFGLDARLSFAASPQFGKKVMWHYSDAPSVEGVGLKVVQKSYDGQPPADYVLFDFIFTNSSAAPVTFYAGMFGDWDIGEDFQDDVGATDLDGRLMYMTNESGGPLAGSLLVSDAAVSGNTFFAFTGPPQPASEYIAALAGDVRTPSVESPNDYLYLHAVGPITLAPSGSDDIWIAIVAGDDLAQLRANAAAAAADVAGRGASSAQEADGLPAGNGVWAGGRHQIRNTTSPGCKTGCTQE